MGNPPDLRRRPNVEPLAYRTREAAAALNIGVRTLFNQTAPRGPIRAARVGGALLYPVDELRRWLSEAANAGPSCTDCRNPTPGGEGGAA